ncbi:MAG: GAF domain-containing protein [Bacteroidota bacterium]
MNYENLLTEIDQILQTSNSSYKNSLTKICQLLENRINYYDWVGFYFKNGDRKELKLLCYEGNETDHNIIPFGKGICGQVAETNQNFLVDDVAAQDNYIACSIHVKSELVVPLFIKNENIGQIDIDSHQRKAFSKKDEDFLVEVNRKIADYLINQQVLPIF